MEIAGNSPDFRPVEQLNGERLTNKQEMKVAAGKGGNSILLCP